MTTQGAPEYIASRRIGDATVTVISEGSLIWAPELHVPDAEWRRALPEADEQGRVPLGLNLVHIRLGNASVLVDPGYDHPASEQQRRLDEVWPGMTRSPGREAALAHLGIESDEITHVLITHAHDDHFAGATTEHDGTRVPRYPRARHVIGREDWEDNPARHESGSECHRHLGTLARLGLLDLVEREREIVPGITMIHSPGESPGHCIVRLRSTGESFYYLGDLFHLHCEVEHPDWVLAWHNPASLRASRERLIAEALAARATLIFTHDLFPAWGHLVSGDGRVRWEQV